MNPELYYSEIRDLKEEVTKLREIVETLSILINKGLIKELLGEDKKVLNGEFYSEEEFFRKHGLKVA